MNEEIDIELLRKELCDFLDHIRDEYGKDEIPCAYYHTVDRFIEKKSHNDTPSEF